MKNRFVKETLYKLVCSQCAEEGVKDMDLTSLKIK